MHTILVVGGGLAGLAAMMFGARAFGFGTMATARVFLALWLAAALVNMWIGVSRAGYPVAAEAPIALVVFAIPAAVALFLGWKLS